MSKGSFGNLPDIKIIIGDGSEKPIEFSLICKTFGINSPEEMVAAYGKLYNWYAVDDTRGLCPEGWSVPSDDDWTALVNYVVSEGFPNEWSNTNGAGNALKSCRQVDSFLGGNCDTNEHPRWDSDSIHQGFNEFGFSAIPGGYRWTTGSFFGVGHSGTWWNKDNAWFGRTMSSYSGSVEWFDCNMSFGFSVRCFREITEEPSLFNLQLDMHPEGAGSVSGAGYYQAGEVVNITATANEGWEFVTWTGAYGNEVSDAADFTYLMPAYDVTLTANFEVKQYTVTVRTDETPGALVKNHIPVPPDVGEILTYYVAHGGYFHGLFEALPPNGYMFNSWTYIVGSNEIKSYFVSINIYDAIDNHTLIAHFAPIGNLYVLVVNNGDGDGEYPENAIVAISAHEPEEGMMFVSWTGDTAYVDDVGAINTTVTMPAYDIEVTATYQTLPQGYLHPNADR